MLLLMIVMFYPLWYVLCGSLSNSSQLVGYRGILYKPLGFNLSAYKTVFRNTLLLRSFGNTVFIVVVGTFVDLVMTYICAYVLSRRNVYWNKFFSKMIIFTMFFGGGLIPTYLLVATTLHLRNSYLALILPNAISVYNMLIMRTSFMAIPESIEESARIDGASHWCILTKIILPLSKAIVAVMILYYGVAQWNAWFDASIYIKDRAKFPLQLILREILIANETSSMMQDVSSADQEGVGETIKYAIIIFSVVPILFVYPYLQKYFVQGVMIGAVKG